MIVKERIEDSKILATKGVFPHDVNPTGAAARLTRHRVATDSMDRADFRVSGPSPANGVTRSLACIFSVLWLVMLAGPAVAQKMHRWVDEDGNMHFSQTPPEDQRTNQSEIVTYGSDTEARADPDCCLELRVVAEDVGGLLLQGWETTDIYKRFPPSQYPEITEVVNFVSGRTYGGFTVSEVGSLAQSTCVNGKFQACRVGEGRVAAGDGSRSASGTLIAEGIVLTNAHAINGCDRIVVGEQATRASVAGIDRERDLALLEVPEVGGKPVSVSAAGRVILGETVTVAGYPLSTMLGALNITNGTVSSESGAGRAGLFQISAPVQPGSSGGPVLDESGDLLGIVVSRLNDEVTYAQSGAIPQNVNFAIGPAVVKAFLDDNGVAYKTGGGQEVIAGTERAAAARDFTLLLNCR